MAAIFVAATRQHVGKTSSCLGIVNGMRARLKDCGFIKPVGQRHVPVFEDADGGLDEKAASAAAANAAAAALQGKTGLASEYGEYSGFGRGGQSGGGELRVDKDVKLFREYFGLSSRYADMSPLVVPRSVGKDRRGA